MVYFVQYYKEGNSQPVDVTVSGTMGGLKQHALDVSKRKGYIMFKILSKPSNSSTGRLTLKGTYKVPRSNPRKRNPISTISGSVDGWQAAHAFRQLPDGRVQILTNPRGKVPSRIKIVKRNPDTGKLHDKTVYTAVSQKVAINVAELLRSKGIIAGIKKNRGGKSWAVKVMDWNANNAKDIIIKYGNTISK
jgi:ribosomal protein S8